MGGDLYDHRRRDGLRWPEQAGCSAYPSFAATEGLTAHAVRTGAPALSNDASRDPRYLANQDNSGSELVPILGRRARSRHAGRGKRPRGASSGSSILDYERLAGAVRSLLDQPPRRSCPTAASSAH